ncbi:MAG TPA: hypothetical protein VHC95_06965 [Opitutales bacterium]|nr:hypothetical protein [Opitutales bacterium]
MKNPRLAEFYRQLRARGETTATLAAKIGRSRVHLTHIFNGSKRGRFTWQVLYPLLTEKELSLLLQCSAWNGTDGKPLAQKATR